MVIPSLIRLHRVRRLQMGDKSMYFFLEKVEEMMNAKWRMIYLF